MTITSYDTQTGYKVKRRLTKRESILLVVIVLFLFLSVGLLVGLLVQKYVVDEKKDVCTSPDCVLGAASLLQSMDQSYSPCEDFYSFVCNGYIAKTPVVAGTPGTEVLITKGQENIQNIKELLERTDPLKLPTAVANAIRIYNQCVNTDEDSQSTVIEDTANLLRSLGGWPIAMNKDAWHSKKDDEFIAFLAKIVRMGFTTELLDVTVMPDLTNSSIIRLTLDQPKSSSHRLIKTLLRKRRQTEQPSHLTDEDKEQYILTVRAMAILLGNKHNNASITDDIGDMWQLKVDLSAIATASDHRMNYTTMYNTMSLWELHRKTNTDAIKFNWVGMLQKIFEGVTNISEDTDTLMIMDMNFMKKLPGVLHKYEQRIITNYVIYEGILTGIQELFESQLSTLPEESRWSRCLTVTNQVMPFAITRLFAENQHFDVNKTIVEAEAMVTGIQEAFKRTFEDNQWLDAETKQAAPLKIDSMQKYIGFPKWIFNDTSLNEYYEEIEVAASPLQTYLKALGKELLKDLEEYRKPIHGNRWTMDATTANAQYELLSNTVWLPIGILTPPVFDSNYLTAMNYGGIGSIIGHEIGHGFDNEGSQFDEFGNLRKWWTDRSLREYANRTKCYLSQYNQYCPASFQPDDGTANSSAPVCLDGVNTLTENVADNIGLQAAFKAYKNWVDTHGTEPKLPGLMKYTPDQVFFISFARMWCENYRDDQMKTIYTNDNHSPGRYRVTGTLSNFPEFAKTFGCTSGPMTRSNQERCSLY